MRASKPPTEEAVAIRLVGSKHWSRSLADLITEAGAVHVRSVNVQQLALDVLLGRRRQLTLRVGFRPLVATWRGRVFDMIWLLAVSRQSRRTLWIGTDVVQTCQDGPLRGWRSRLRDRLIGRAACGAPWFVEELAGVGVTAEYVRFPHRTRIPDFVEWPTEFAVSTYVPAMKPAFYGAQVLPAIADATPDVLYLVYGDGEVPERPNIRALGHVPHLAERLADSVVHLRLTEHDAIAGTVRESLALGRYVLFGYELPGIVPVDVRGVDEIATHIRRLASSFRAGTLAPNWEGVELIRQMDPLSDATSLLTWIEGR